MILDEPPLEVAGVVRALDDGLFRAGVEQIDGNVAHVFLAAWGVSRAELQRFAAPLERALA